MQSQLSSNSFTSLYATHSFANIRHIICHYKFLPCLVCSPALRCLSTLLSSKASNSPKTRRKMRITLINLGKCPFLKKRTLISSCWEGATHPRRWKMLFLQKHSSPTMIIRLDSPALVVVEKSFRLSSCRRSIYNIIVRGPMMRLSSAKRRVLLRSQLHPPALMTIMMRCLACLRRQLRANWILIPH